MNESKLLRMLSDLCDSTERLVEFLRDHEPAAEEVWDAEIKIASIRRAIELGEGEGE
jgi:hypothetical protein